MMGSRLRHGFRGGGAGCCCRAEKMERADRWVRPSDYSSDRLLLGACPVDPSAPIALNKDTAVPLISSSSLSLALDHSFSYFSSLFSLLYYSTAAVEYLISSSSISLPSHYTLPVFIQRLCPSCQDPLLWKFLSGLHRCRLLQAH